MALPAIFMSLGLLAVFQLTVWWNSKRLALRMLQARRLRDEESHLQDLLQEISLLAGQEPAPTLYLSPLQLPNAMAAGRSPEDAVVILTQGLLQRLEAEELRGVLAHELAHIVHRDIAYQSFWAVVHKLPVLLRLRPPGLFGLLLRWLLPLLGRFLRQGMSRSREFQADAAAARWLGTGKPLRQALLKLAELEQPARKSWLASHPSTSERLRRLDAQDLQRSAARLWLQSPDSGTSSV